MSANAKLLLQKAGAKKEIQRWDSDFDCDDDAIFRSSVSSASSAESRVFSSESAPLSIDQGAFRKGSRLPTKDYLSSFREGDTDDVGFTSSTPTITATTRKFNQLVMKPHSESDTLRSPRKTSSQHSTIKQPGTLGSKSLRKWSEDLDGDFGDSGFELGKTGTYRYRHNNDTIRAAPASKAETESSIVKGTFFRPPSEVFATPTETKVPITTLGTVTHLQRRLTKKKQKQEAPQVEDDFEDGFGDDLELDASNLNKFTSNSANPDASLWDDEINDFESGSRLDSMSSSLFSHAPSATTASEIDGEDFLDGVILPDSQIDFKKALKERQQAAAEAEEEQEQEQEQEQEEEEAIHLNQSKHNTLGSKFNQAASSSSDFSLHRDDFDEAAEDADDEMDFFQDFELNNGDFIINNNTLHRNVKLKGERHEAPQKDPKPSPRKRLGMMMNMNGSTPNLNISSPTKSPTRAASSVDRIRAKQSLPVLRPRATPILQHQMSMVGEDTFIEQTRQRSSGNEVPAGAASLSYARKQYLQQQKQSQDSTPRKSSLAKKSRSPMKKSAIISFTASTSPNKQSFRFSRARTGKVLGDGTELDDFDDLPVDISQEMSFTVTPIASSKTIGRHHHHPTIINRISLNDYIEKPVKTIKKRPDFIQSTPESTRLSPSRPRHRRAQTQSQSKRQANIRGPRLIQQLSTPISTTIRGYNENMHYNVQTCQWEGNNEDLRRFDSAGYNQYSNNHNNHNSNNHNHHNNSSVNGGGKAPGLIAFISSNEIKVVGDMVFDPARMCWISIREDEEEDPFEGLDDMDMDVTIKGIKNPRHHGEDEIAQRHGQEYYEEEFGEEGVFTDGGEDFESDEAGDVYYDEVPGMHQGHASRRPKSRQHLNSLYNESRASSMYELSSSASTDDGTRLQKHGDFVVGTEFTMKDETQKKLKQYHERWQHRVGGWFLPGKNDNKDRKYLWELRRMVMKQ